MSESPETRPAVSRRGQARRTLPLLLPALLIAAPLVAQEWKEFRTARQIGDVRSLEVEILYGAGQLSIEPADGGMLYDVRMRYDAERFVPIRSWMINEGAGKLGVSLSSERSNGAAVSGPGEESDPDLDLELRGGRGASRPLLLEGTELDLDLEDLRRLGDRGGRLAVRLGTPVPTRLRVAVGAAEGELELGGLSLASLELETGASQTDLTFDRPNGIRMEDLHLKVGAAEFRAEGLGNAHFERFRFEGGVGDVTLDFSGEWRESATASVKMGLGALRVRIPRDLAVRIVRDSFLSSFRADGLMRVGDGYQTEGWETADVRLEIGLDAIFGAIHVERVP